MNRKILTISVAGNPVDASCGTIDGEVLPPAAPPLPSTAHIRKALHALHDLGTRTGRPSLQAQALKASLELRALSSLVSVTTEVRSKELSRA